ncbi:MAG: tRNA 2-thiocytidine biosynthesis TtcA family protein [candidate division WOR-3 bacterium]|nr:tRNA 2-thiocytidine biosynthesis TtcA family protein [candidate division WOR-3 bacterium]MCX7757738.1 tRNA 2-thiocytidine biosynthesis TtcA family protein [candidate division WOR-3 bacterium]MDW7987822.1 tRNA 2-thiocytidine biosynthesis TtcA family protein [candidate division WOR-3 bacterium]
MSEIVFLKRTLTFLNRVIAKHDLIRDGEKILTAVSGGIDSLVLMDILLQYSNRYRKNLQLLAYHLNPGFPGWKTEALKKFFEHRQIEYLIDNVDIYTKLNSLKKSICYFCARERRKKLFEVAQKYEIKKIAFAHHMDDVNETYILNLMYSANASTFVIKQGFFPNKTGEVLFYIIRPLYYFDKDHIKKYAKYFNIKPVKNLCPFEKTNERMEVRKFLQKMYKKDPQIRSNIFWGIKNIKLNYLP